MKYLLALLAMAAGVRAAARQALFTRAQPVALPRYRPFVLPRYRGATHEHKTVDAWIIEGEPVVVETWLFTYPDGHTETLQRRHRSDDPAMRASFLDDPEYR